MIQYIDTLKQIFTSYWARSVTHYLFFLALIIVFFKANDAKKRDIFFWLPIVLYIVIISPVGVVFGNKFLHADMVAYMCRLVSFVPYFFLMAYACVLLVGSVAGMKRFFSVFCLCISIMFLGSDLIYISNGYRFERSENVYKIPTDLLVICDYMDSVDEDPVVALNTSYSYMVRQYDPSLHLLVGARSDGIKLSDELGADEPDVTYIMQTTCALGGDFVIAKNKDSVQSAFLEVGFRPCLETHDFLLYEVGGYPGTKQTYNDIEQVVRWDFYDADGEPSLSNDDISSIEFVYDEIGRVIGEHYYGVDGEAKLNIRGYSGLVNTYGETGTIDRIDYLGLEGTPAISDVLGYASVSYVRDAGGNIIEERYFDDHGEAIALTGGYAGIRSEFDGLCRVTRIDYLDKKGALVGNDSGVATILYDYENKLGVLELYKDLEGNPVENTNGCYGMINQYGANGMLVYQIYTDENGQPVKGNAGYSKVAYMYDRNNRLIRVSYFDTNGFPALCTEGYAGYRRNYDEDGNAIDVYFGIDGSVIELTDSAA